MQFPNEYLNKIILGDCLEAMKDIPDDSIDSIITDPPFSISFMGKKWDTISSMTDFFVPIWKESLRIMKPGAFAFVMCSPRADVMARQINCLEEARFRVNYSPIFFTFATGFPKGANVAKLIDKQLGTKGRVVGKRISAFGNPRYSETQNGRNLWGKPSDVEVELTDIATPEAEALSGSFTGFSPKPALEIVLVVMKSLSEKNYTNQALKNQKGVTWLDDCRIPLQNNENLNVIRKGERRLDTRGQGWGFKSVSRDNKGRFPSNLLVSDNVLDTGKITKSTGGKSGHTGAYGGGYKEEYYGGQAPGKGDSGGFSRYFSLDSWFEKKLGELPKSVQQTFPFLLVPKASRTERNKGCEDMSEKPIRGNYNDSSQFGSLEKIQNSSRPDCKNNHPCVKPIKLMTYLITLGSRRGDLILDPFAGSGTTCIAARMLGRRWIGIEIDPEYVKIARARLEVVPDALL